MNNSAYMESESQGPDLTERAGKLTTLIEAAEMLLQTREWSTLREEEFDAALARYERLLLKEAQSPKVDMNEILRLQGKIEAMKRYDLTHMKEKWRAELEEIRKRT